jgi:hypothetical protein
LDPFCLNETQWQVDACRAASRLTEAIILILL